MTHYDKHGLRLAKTSLDLDDPTTWPPDGDVLADVGGGWRQVQLGHVAHILTWYGVGLSPVPAETGDLWASIAVEPWGDPEHRFDESKYYDVAAKEWVHVVICTNPEHDPCPTEREMFRGSKPRPSPAAA